MTECSNNYEGINLYINLVLMGSFLGELSCFFSTSLIVIATPPNLISEMRNNHPLKPSVHP